MKSSASWAEAKKKLRWNGKSDVNVRLADFYRTGVYYAINGEANDLKIGLRREGIFHAYADEYGEYDSGRGEIISFERRGFFVGLYSLDYGDGRAPSQRKGVAIRQECLPRTRRRTC